MSESAPKARAQNTEDEPAVFIVRRPYRWVRHPRYLVAIMLLWSWVDFTSSRSTITDGNGVAPCVSLTGTSSKSGNTQIALDRFKNEAS